MMSMIRLSTAVMTATLLFAAGAEAQRKPAPKSATPPATSAPPRAGTPPGKPAFQQPLAAANNQSALVAGRNARTTSMSRPATAAGGLVAAPSAQAEPVTPGASARQRLAPSRQSSWRASGAIQPITSESSTP